MTAKTTKTAATAPAMKLLADEKAIDAALTSISRRGATLQHDIHVAACSVLQHIGKHSDIRIVAKLLNALPDMTRKNAMRDWLAAFGPVAFDGDAPVFVQGRKIELAKAMKEPFWSFSPEKPYVALDVAKLISGVIKKLQRDEKEVEGVNHATLIATLEQLQQGTPASAH